MLYLKMIKKLAYLFIILVWVSSAFAVSQNSIRFYLKNKFHNNNSASEHMALTDQTSLEVRLVNFVHKMISNLHYSSYKLGGTRFDTLRGIYVLDCSNYVDHLLEKVHPNAYSRLVAWSGTEKPTTYDYYHFFTHLYDRPQRYWYSVQDIQQLRPGDIIVFRYKKQQKKILPGHIMIVMDKPKQDNNTYEVRVADSAPYRHSKDTRKLHVSGIGIGTLLLKVDPKTYQPYAYAWKTGSRWKKNVNFAMARPGDEVVVDNLTL